MRFDSEHDLESALFDHWFELRQARRLDEVLPGAATYRAEVNGQAFGYRTVDHRIHRQFPLPGTSPAGGVGYADLVEHYWSVRVKGDWGPNLHVNVVELKNETLQVAHLEQLFRYITALRAGLAAAGLYPYDPRFRSNDRCIFVGGALIGPRMSESAAVVDSILAAQWGAEDETPLRVGIIDYHPTDGLRITRFSEYDRFPLIHTDSESPDAAEAVRSLFDDTEFFPNPPARVLSADQLAEIPLRVLPRTRRRDTE